MDSLTVRFLFLVDIFLHSFVCLTLFCIFFFKHNSYWERTQLPSQKEFEQQQRHLKSVHDTNTYFHSANNIYIKILIINKFDSGTNDRLKRGSNGSNKCVQCKEIEEYLGMVFYFEQWPMMNRVEKDMHVVRVAAIHTTDTHCIYNF